MFLDTAIAKLAGIAVPAVGANPSDAEKEESCCKLTMSLMARNISGWASRFNEKERGNYYSFILRGVPDNFLKEVFQIRAASEMLTVNVETIRRKIRDKKIPVLNEGKVNTGVGYEITGATVISLAKKNYQKESVLAYCIGKYPHEIIISLMQLLIDEGKAFKDLTDSMTKGLVNAAFFAEIKLKDIPKGIVAETNANIYENYVAWINYVEDSKKRQAEKNNSPENNAIDFSQKEKEYLERIENLEKENAELFEENLYLKINFNKLNLKLLIEDLEKIEKDNKNIEYRKLVRKICIVRERIEYLEELKENPEELNHQGREGWPNGII